MLIHCKKVVSNILDKNCLDILKSLIKDSKNSHANIYLDGRPFLISSLLVIDILKSFRTTNLFRNTQSTCPLILESGVMLPVFVKLDTLIFKVSNITVNFLNSGSFLIKLSHENSHLVIWVDGLLDEFLVDASLTEAIQGDVEAFLNLTEVFAIHKQPARYHTVGSAMVKMLVQNSSHTTLSSSPAVLLRDQMFTQGIDWERLEYKHGYIADFPLLGLIFKASNLSSRHPLISNIALVSELYPKSRDADDSLRRMYSIALHVLCLSIPTFKSIDSLYTFIRSIGLSESNFAIFLSICTKNFGNIFESGFSKTKFLNFCYALLRIDRYIILFNLDHNTKLKLSNITANIILLDGGQFLISSSALYSIIKMFEPLTFTAVPTKNGVFALSATLSKEKNIKCFDHIFSAKSITITVLQSGYYILSFEGSNVRILFDNLNDFYVLETPSDSRVKELDLVDITGCLPCVKFEVASKKIEKLFNNFMYSGTVYHSNLPLLFYKNIQLENLMFCAGTIMNVHPFEFILRSSSDSLVLATISKLHSKMDCNIELGESLWEICKDALMYDYFNAVDDLNFPSTYQLYKQVFKNLSVEESITFCLAAKQVQRFFKDIFIVV